MLTDLQPFIQIEDPDGGLYDVRICQGTLVFFFHTPRGARQVFSIPLTAQDAQAVSSLCLGYVAVQRAAGMA